jgi:Tfp pilus assembly protein PilF
LARATNYGRRNTLELQLNEELVRNVGGCQVSSANITANEWKEVPMRYHFSIFISIVIATAGESISQSIEIGSPAGCAIWGHVVIPGRSSQEPTLVELVGKEAVPSQKTRVVDGNYRFNSVPSGSYQFRVSDQSGRVIYKETKMIHDPEEYIILSASPLRSAFSRANIVSFAELKHTTPRKAREQFDAAVKATEIGDPQAVVAHLLKALDIDPQFSEAHTNLAVQYGKMGRYQESLEQAHRAFEISPGNPDIGYNYAMFLLAARKYQESEPIVRCMIKNRYYTAQMKAALAVSLIGQRRDFDEAFGYLRDAATEFPLSRLLIARTLVEIGWGEAAVDQVTAYLKSSANPCERARLATWVTEHSRPTVKEVEGSH